MKILSQKENPLYDRKEITAEASCEKGTPSRKEMVKELSSEIGVPQENIAIDNVLQHFGTKTVVVKAKAYANAEALKKFEPAYKKKREIKEKKIKEKG